MYCHQCGSYYFSSIRCPDCTTMLSSRRKISSVLDITLEKVILYFEYQCWINIGFIDMEGTRLCCMVHMHSAAPLIRIGLSVYEEGVPRHLTAIVHICNLKEHPELQQPFKLALGLPYTHSITKFQIVGNSQRKLTAIISCPLFSGTLADELVYLFERELGLLLHIVTDYLGIELVPGAVMA